MKEKSSQLLPLSETLQIGNRVPQDFFITKGKGESDIMVHGGSYHLALYDAGIEMCNIMYYSSILPGIARKVKRPARITHGSVMETIMATATAETGKRATAAIIFGWMYDRKTRQKYGGLVCEYSGPLMEEEASKLLRAGLNELYTNGYDKDYEMREIVLNFQSIVPKKKYGTALVALCFTNYVVPVIR